MVCSFECPFSREGASIIPVCSFIKQHSRQIAWVSPLFFCFDTVAVLGLPLTQTIGFTDQFIAFLFHCWFLSIGTIVVLPANPSDLA